MYNVQYMRNNFYMFEGVQCTHFLCFIGVTLKQWLRGLIQSFEVI